MQERSIDIVRKVIEKDESAAEVLHKMFTERSPVYRLTGLKLRKVSEGYVKAEFHYKEELSRVGGMLHGGAIMMIVDQVAGTAAMTVNKGTNQVTVELKVNFLKPLTQEEEPFTVVGKVIKSGKTIIVCEGRIYNSKEEMCVIGLGTYYIFQ